MGHRTVMQRQNALRIAICVSGYHVIGCLPDTIGNSLRIRKQNATLLVVKSGGS
jgi:hypothetical protein